MTSLLELAARCEAATGPDRELDAAIAVAALGFFEIPPRWEGGPIGYGYIDRDGARVHPGHGGKQCVREFTASLDAAMTLLDQYGVLLHLSDIGADGLPLARVGRPDLPSGPIFAGISCGIAKDATPTSGLTLALCAAALRARAAS